MKGIQKVTVRQVKSPIRRQRYQEECLKGLGLNKLHRIKTLEATPSVMGLINKIKHLIEIVE